MSKVDIKAAYHCIPVRPADWSSAWYAMWSRSYYFYKTLPVWSDNFVSSLGEILLGSGVDSPSRRWRPAHHSLCR